MKKLIIYLSAFLTFFFNLTAKESEAKKKAYIYFCNGGGGHVCATKKLKDCLNQDYDIVSVNLLTEIFKPFDLIHTITFKSYNGEDWYNYNLRKGWTGLINMATPIGAKYIKSLEKKLAETIEENFGDNNPSVLISVMPFFNSALLRVAKKRNIPFYIVATDLDTTNYLNGLDNPKYDKFFYLLPFEDVDIRKKIEPAKINKEYIKVVGFPVRSEFLEKKDVKKLKEEFKLPSDKPIVMLLMGAAGSYATFTYFKFLKKQKDPMHLIICLGRNEQLRKRIEKVRIPDHITISVVGFTDRIADYMASSDLLITKSGPTTICEALAIKVPMIVDHMSKVLFWEEFNIEFIKKNNLGDAVKNFKELEVVLKKYLSKDKRYYNSKKSNISNFQRYDFKSEFLKLLKEIKQLQKNI